MDFKQAEQLAISRGNAIATMFMAGAASVLGANGDAVAQGQPTLAAAAAHQRRFYGSAVRIRELDAEKDLRDAVLRECAQLVPEFEMNWNHVEPQYGQLTFDRMDELATFANYNAKSLRGHTLLWHLGVPDWAATMLRERKDWNIVARYFGSVIPRYGDVIHQWEVVNEAIDPGARSDGLRNSVFMQAFGPDYISRAFVQARTFAPHAKLFINEYGLEYDIPEQRQRRYFLLKLLERLKNARVPLDGLGLQGHLDLANGYVSQPSIAAFLREVIDMKLAIIVTELDVKESNYVASPQARDRLVADEVRRYLEVVLSAPHVLGVTTWGLSDRHSWLQVTPQDYARFPGAWTHGDGPGYNRGLPLDSSMQPKPMYYALRDMLWTVRPRGVRSFGR
jgi:endo-1,4-beta-xylanase